MMLVMFRSVRASKGSRRDTHYDDSRYHCLNLHSVFQKGTVEFRLFNGTVHAGKIKAYIQLCLAIGAQALNQSCASRRKTVTENEKSVPSVPGPGPDPSRRCSRPDAPADAPWRS